MNGSGTVYVKNQEQPLRFKNVLYFSRSMNTMKSTFGILLISLLAFGCKKDTSNQVPAPDNSAPAVVYNYNISVINEKASLTVGDTLIIKINDAKPMSWAGAAVPTSASLKCKSGDKLYIYHNPGTMKSGNETIIQSNVLQVYLDGGIMAPITFKGCRCIGRYDGVVK